MSIRSSRKGSSAWRRKGHEREQQGSLRILFTSTRFISSLFWLTIIVATLLFVLPYSERLESLSFYGYVALFIAVILAHRFFPYEGYHPIGFFALLLGTDALIAMMVYFTGGNQSSLSLLFVVVIIFSSTYFELLEIMLITAVTSAFYFMPVTYEAVGMEELKNMAIAVPIYFIIALCGFFVISKAREQEGEKHALTFLYDQADTKRRELSTLYSVSLKFASTLDEDELMNILIEKASELVANDAIGVSLWETRRNLWVKSYRGFKREDISMLVERTEENPLYMSASAILPVVLRDTEEDSLFALFLRKLGFNSMIVVPLYASSSVIGVLYCTSWHKDAFDDDSARILLTLSSEAALALEKARLYQTTLEDKTKIETIINSLTDGLLVIDRDANLVLANPTITNLMNLEQTDYNTPLPNLLQRSQHNLDFKELSYNEALDKVLGKGENFRNELVLGTEPPIFFQVIWVPLKDSEGRVNGAVILFHDITYFIELDLMKSEFISIVSHELKTPLTSIKGFVRLLTAQRDGPISEKQKHYLDIVQKQTESLTMLINDLLDLSRIEAGIIRVKKEPVMLQEMVRGVVQQLDNMAGEKGTDIFVEIPDDLPAICGDKERLSQVFMNLLHNAIKFTPPGGEVRIKANGLKEKCLVEVSDTGIGIPPQELPRIFDKFYQVDSSSTRQQSGTGLGLSITKKLVNALGGEIWVDSMQGKGSVFGLTLPLYQAKRESGEDVSGSMGEAASG
jgi:two-component system phosphate regulon sensor histidine kinase PhoR